MSTKNQLSGGRDWHDLVEVGKAAPSASRFAVRNRSPLSTHSSSLGSANAPEHRLQQKSALSSSSSSSSLQPATTFRGQGRSPKSHDTGSGNPSPSRLKRFLQGVSDRIVGKQDESAKELSKANSSMTHKEPLIGIIDTNFSANSHGAEMQKTISRLNPEASLWLGRGVGEGRWADSLKEFVQVAQASGQRAIANLSFDLTQVNRDGRVSTRYQLTADEQAALASARKAGIPVFTSIGNEASSRTAWEQADKQFDNIVVIGGVEGRDRAATSSYGNHLDLLAPNQLPDSSVKGTSLATAYATGVASKVWAANPQLNARQLEQVLKSSATDLNTPGRDKETGFGSIDPTAAIQRAKQMTGQPIEIIPNDRENAVWQGTNGAIASERPNRLLIGSGDPVEETRLRKENPDAARAVDDRQKLTLQRSTTSTSGKTSVSVGSGDTLWRIAQTKLGNGNRWRELLKADGKPFTEQEASQLRVGTQVYLPSSPPKTPPAQEIASLDRIINDRHASTWERNEARDIRQQKEAAKAPFKPKPIRLIKPAEDDRWSWSERGHALLDVVGAIDPTPITDLINATWHAAEGDWTSAGLTAVGIIPYVGDLAKVGKYTKYVDETADAVRAPGTPTSQPTRNPVGAPSRAPSPQNSQPTPNPVGTNSSSRDFHRGSGNSGTQPQQRGGLGLLERRSTQNNSIPHQSSNRTPQSMGQSTTQQGDTHLKPSLWNPSPPKKIDPTPYIHTTKDLTYLNDPLLLSQLDQIRQGESLSEFARRTKTRIWDKSGGELTNTDRPVLPTNTSGTAQGLRDKLGKDTSIVNRAKEKTFAITSDGSVFGSGWGVPEPGEKRILPDAVKAFMLQTDTPLGISGNLDFGYNVPYPGKESVNKVLDYALKEAERKRTNPNSPPLPKPKNYDLVAEHLGNYLASHAERQAVVHELIRDPDRAVINIGLIGPATICSKETVRNPGTGCSEFLSDVAMHFEKTIVVAERIKPGSEKPSETVWIFHPDGRIQSK